MDQCRSNVHLCHGGYAIREFILVQLSAHSNKPRSWSHHPHCPSWPWVVGVVRPHPFGLDKRATSGESPDGCVLRDQASVAELPAISLPWLSTVVATDRSQLVERTNLDCGGKTLERVVDWQVHFLVEDATASNDCFC